MLGAIAGLTGATAGIVGSAVKGVVSAVKAPFTDDSSSVSKEGLLLSNLSGDTASQILAGGQRMNVQQLQQMLKKKAVWLQKKLAEICKENGISTNGNFTLNVDKNGSIILKGENSQKVKLEQLLNSDSEFAREFKDAKQISDFLSSMMKSKK